MSGHSSGSTSATSGASEASGSAQTSEGISSTNAAMALADDAGFNDIKSLADLKNKSPKLYQYMMVSIAQNICIQIKRQQDRLTEEWKKFREDT